MFTVLLHEIAEYKKLDGANSGNDKFYVVKPDVSKLVKYLFRMQGRGDRVGEC